MTKLLKQGSALAAADQRASSPRAKRGEPHYGQHIMLRLVGSDIVHLDDGTCMWIDLRHFAIETEAGDLPLLASLVASYRPKLSR
jgi:hypothetical protein